MRELSDRVQAYGKQEYRRMSFTGKLHPYQVEPVERFIHRGSLLLAFSPGTGKTIIAIAAAEKLLSDNDISTVLIICPASLKYQWQDRIVQFSTRPVLVIDGDKSKRSDQFNRFIFGKDVKYLVTGYDSVIYDHEYMSKINPGMVVCDEASAIKSFRTQRSKRIKKLFKDVPYKMALTATPIENKPEELYSIMQWVDPTVLGRYDLFEKAYINRHSRGWVTSYKNLDTLRLRMGEAIARKTRFDPEVRPYLPDVDEGNWTVPMSEEVAAVYSVIADDMLQELSVLDRFQDFDPFKFSQGLDESTPPGKLMAMHMCLEMLLCHPDLIRWSAKEYEKDSPNGSLYASYLVQSGILDGLHNSPKMELLEAELSIIGQDPDSKVLIYSKYKEMGNILQDNLSLDGIKFNGDMNARQKEAVKKTFTDDPYCRLFLSSYAGGYGLDMNMADYLINFDLPWSFGAQDQINSRHIRASSNFSKVYIRNLITQDSIEERKFRILERKRRMSDLAIDGAVPDNLAGSTVTLDADFLRSHLEFFRRTH
jgi:SNF2 family DNA or RNA helicase